MFLFCFLVLPIFAEILFKHLNFSSDVFVVDSVQMSQCNGWLHSHIISFGFKPGDFAFAFTQVTGKTNSAGTKPVIIVETLLHAREWITTAAAIYTIDNVGSILCYCIMVQLNMMPASTYLPTLNTLLHANSFFHSHRSLFFSLSLTRERLRYKLKAFLKQEKYRQTFDHV